ncbi:MAG: hypothetical protein ACFFDP_05930, partial [Promethearchaeota archaeon]
EVHIDFKRTWVIANRFPTNLSNKVHLDLENRLAKEGLHLAGIIPADDPIASYNLQGRSLLELPDSNPAYQAMKAIAKKIGLLGDETLLELLGRSTITQT